MTRCAVKVGEVRKIPHKMSIFLDPKQIYMVLKPSVFHPYPFSLPFLPFFIIHLFFSSPFPFYFLFFSLSTLFNLSYLFLSFHLSPILSKKGHLPTLFTLSCTTVLAEWSMEIEKNKTDLKMR